MSRRPHIPSKTEREDRARLAGEQRAMAKAGGVCSRCGQRPPALAVFGRGADALCVCLNPVACDARRREAMAEEAR